MAANPVILNTGIKIPVSPTSGYVLTSDSAGVGTWQASAGSTTQRTFAFFAS